jgi:hypothetical protein
LDGVLILINTEMRWSIYIDIQGFSDTYRNNSALALQSLGCLMEGIYQIGSAAPVAVSNRLFAHQISDGFIIVSDGRPTISVAIAILLMRLAAKSGGMVKTGISEGHFQDVRGCYPDVIRNNSTGNGLLRLGDGVMTIFSVMGTALINAHGMTNCKSGSLLLVNPQMAAALPQSLLVTERSEKYVCIDWVHSELPELDDMAAKASIRLPSIQDTEAKVRRYIRDANPPPPPEWLANTLRLNNCGDSRGLP